MCNCITWARVPLQTSLPQPHHHVDCEDYKLERFSKVECDGVWCIMEPHEAIVWVDESDGEYSMSDIMLTRDQFERLPEFEGF